MIVYLDSQDYSHIAAPPRGKEAFFAALVDELRSLVSRGKIEIRYSAIHISEMAHITQTAMKFSVPRTEILSDLCRGKCMRYWHFVAEDELLANFEPKPITATSDTDQWFETDLGAIGNLADYFKKELQEKLKSKGANRKLRRKAGTLDIGRLLTQTEQGKQLIQNFAQSLSERFSLVEPISLDVMTAYARGAVGTPAFREYIRNVMFDPVTLMSQLSPRIDTEGKLPRVVRDQGKLMFSSLNPALENLARVIPTFSHGPAFDGLWKEIRSSPERMRISIRRKFLKSLIAENAEKLNGMVFDDAGLDALHAPIVDTLSTTMGAFMKHAISAAEAGQPVRLFKLSDAPDLLHACHIPHVDIFRCDTAWTDMLAPAGRKHGVAVVGRIEDLLPTIRKKLENMPE